MQSDEYGGRPGHVYVMRRCDGVRKVGSSVNLRLRRNELACMNGSMEIEIFWTMKERATWFVESQMHTILIQYRCEANEYYMASIQQIIAAFRSAKAWARERVPNEDLGTVSAIRQTGISSYKRLGYKTPAAYARRLAVAEANKAKADAEKQAPEGGKKGEDK